MTNYKYLIIGGGMTGDAAVRGIRDLDADGTIGMISSETDMPYSRPPLSKGMWKGRPIEKVWRGTDKFNVSVHLNTTVAMIDPAAKRVYDDKGGEYSYEKLLLATGGTPKRLPIAGTDIIYFRTLQDYLRLHTLAEERETFLVIGSGFIGSEIAAALTMFGKKVTMVFRDKFIGESIYPKKLSKYITDYFREKGVDLVPEDEVISVEKTEDMFKVSTKGGKTFDVNGVIAGVGIQANTGLAESAEINVDDGIVVDDHLQTSATDIYAAGDVARFPHFTLGKPKRIEHEDNSLKMGKQAGRIMAGADEAYTHTPYFYSDLFDLGYEAVGELNSELDMIEDWQEPNKKGVVYYLEDGRVRGVLTWNIFGKVNEATALMQEEGPFKAKDLKGRLS
jgi:3-phenylpropionate/trans-cinnamate dioxygenase ferredoxin reductase component